MKILAFVVLLNIGINFSLYAADSSPKSENKQTLNSKQKIILLSKTVYPVPAVFSVQQSTPSRIFTPNGDGINDAFTLTLDNQSGNIIKQKKIYDLSGSEVADFKVVGDETATTATLRWDGRDSNGDTVRSGIYIYQVQAEGKVLNGTIVVAR